MLPALTTATACRSASRSSAALAATTPRLKRSCSSSARSRRNWAGNFLVIPGPSKARNPESITPAQGLWIADLPLFAALRNDMLLRRGLRQHCRIVVEYRRQPSLALRERLVLAPRVIVDLIALDLAYAEIMTVRMAEIEAAYRGARPHREAFGQFDAGRVLGVEQRE